MIHCGRRGKIPPMFVRSPNFLDDLLMKDHEGFDHPCIEKNTNGGTKLPKYFLLGLTPVDCKKVYSID